MGDAADDDDHPTFLSFGRTRPDGTEIVLSRAAFQMHGFAAMNSLQFGTPGFVPDDYLNGITAETTITAQELCSAGLWRRFDGTDLDDEPVGGYVIIDRELLEMTLDAHEHVQAMPLDDVDGDD